MSRSGSDRGRSAALKAALARLEALHPRAIDLSLGRIERLLARLGHPERKLPPVVHVAGTNGKGSQVAYLRAIFEAAGYRAHAFTSPHLVRFNERIRLSGGVIGDDRLAALIDEVEAVNAGGEITFFEVTTAIALLAFSRDPADVVLLEVGLGGIYDATNVLDALELAVITPVSHDHEKFLGTDLAHIAREKAGIMKAGVPAVIGPQTEAPLRAIEAHAQYTGAPLVVHGRDWTTEPLATGGFLWRGADNDVLALPPPSLAGPHQIDNAGTAVAAARRLTRFALPDDAIRAGIASAEWPARFQRLKRGPLVETLGPGRALWLDGGHNKAGGEAIGRTLLGMAGSGPWHVVVAMLRSKDASGFLRPIAAHADVIYGIPHPNQNAAADPRVLAGIGRTCGRESWVADSVPAAIADIAMHRPREARVLICGSLYLAGEVLANHA